MNRCFDFSNRFFVDFNLVFGTDYENFERLQNQDWAIGKMIQDRINQFDLEKLYDLIKNDRKKEAMRMIDQKIRLERLAKEFSKVCFQQLEPMNELF